MPIEDFTIEEARELVWKEFSCISDEQLQNLCEGIYKFCRNIIKYDPILNPKASPDEMKKPLWV